jgi:hypothetical protein
MPRTGRPVQNEKERFWKYLTVKSVDECWPWKGNTYPNGYGLFRRGGKLGHNIGAHRLSYEFAYGVPDRKLYVCHKCDNPICCNPNHLFLDTPGANMIDAIHKGRKLGTSQGGTTGGQYKLSVIDRFKLKGLIKEGKTHSYIASIFNVHVHTVANYIKLGDDNHG